MNAPIVVPRRPPFRSRVGHASIALLRSAMADDWRPEKAARQLLATVDGDRRVLALVRAKLSRAVLERPTRITERATLTLDHALTVVGGNPGPVPAFIPRQESRDV
jgi:hypothetical protein